MRKQEVTSFHEILNLLKIFFVDEKCVDNADLVKNSCQDKIIQQQSDKIKDNREKNCTSTQHRISAPFCSTVTNKLH